MDENKKDSNEKEVKPKTTSSTDEKKGFSIKTFYNDLKGEFKKIIWPSRNDLTKQTITVIATSIIIGLVICGMDYVFAIGYDLLIGLIS